MQLWNDYEGKTIADTYTIGQLLRPEGRSALFALSGTTEAPAIIRLTESLNDEGQMLACWRRVSELKQENLLAIRHFGETNFEGTPLTYAVLEPTDAKLADLLAERRLDLEEAKQVATSLVAALSALHAADLVHEHIDAINVFAVGESVKLRTDCVRENLPDAITTPAECTSARERDVRDLATLLLRALTLEKKLSPATRLAAPFDKIIPNAMNGTFGLAEIANTLNPPVVKPLVPETVFHQATAASAATLPPVSADPSPTATDNPLLYQRRVVNSTVPAHRKVPPPVWAGAGIAAVVALGIFLHHGNAADKITSVPATTAAQPVVRPVVQPVASAPVAAPAPATAANEASPAVARMQPGWYVIAYTFNHEEQARKRAEAIVKRHGWLHPEVIAPGGGSAYLVALGGPMSRDQAESTRARARQVGMPRDTFVRNYKPS
ncbi:MAG: hypothetical protein NVSMB62_16470 [Acidobacteriaceae bacterium]